jgi:hypothetical protein
MPPVAPKFVGKDGRLPIVFKRRVHLNGRIDKSRRKKGCANRPDEDGGEKPFVIGVHGLPNSLRNARTLAADQLRID